MITIEYNPIQFYHDLSYIQRMQQKQDASAQQSRTLRSKLLPLFRTNVKIAYLPFYVIETILQVVTYMQVLKFCIDYYSLSWFGSIQPIFLYLDFSYYLGSVSESSYQLVLILALVYMNLYWLITLSLFIMGKKMSTVTQNMKKVFLLLSKTILYMPLLNIVLSLSNCSFQNQYRTCYNIATPVLSGITYVSFILFSLLVFGQSFIDFEYLPDLRNSARLKNSNFTSTALIIFILIYEVTAYFGTGMVSLAVMDGCGVLQILLFIIKDQHQQEILKQIELSMICLNLLALVMTNLIFFLGIDFNFLLFCLLAILMIAAIMQMRLYSLKFQLENINKWPTSDIMIRYAATLRYFLSRKDQYIFRVFINGYGQVHRQKCDNPTCPYQTTIDDAEFVKRNIPPQMRKQYTQIIKTQLIVKKIYGDGHKITPISAELQLQNAIFLYDQNQKESSLKNLLSIKYEDLAFDKYYKFSLLKSKIHEQMREEPQKLFLDLVSQLQVKHKESQIMRKFEKAALINLQFWSVLNEDHPDFQKLNQIGAARIRIRMDVKQEYEQICLLAHSQKVTNLFVHYLEAIENDEAAFNTIYDEVKDKFRLEDKIILQDWSNSSQATILISVEEANFGTIIDINSSCAYLFGYQKFEVLNRPVKILFHEELRDEIKDFLNPNIIDRTFYVTHKSGYMLKIRRKPQNYNSMETGMTSICTLDLQVSSTSCFLILNKNQKIIGISASCISLLGIQMKIFEGDVFARNIFKCSFPELHKMADRKDISYPITDILLKANRNEDDEENKRNSYKFLLSVVQQKNNEYYCFEFTIQKERASFKNSGTIVNPVPFEFQVQATVDNMKYFGAFDSQDNLLSQFSQLSYAESLKMQNVSHNFGEKITTLRLKNNIIQVIQNQDEEDLTQNNLMKGAENNVKFQNLARKDEQEIFESKGSFEAFIQNYHFAKAMNSILLVCVFSIITLYVSYYYISCSHNSSTVSFTTQITYEYLIIGALTKELSLLAQMDLISKNSSNEVAQRFVKIYQDNVNFLQSIKLLGTQPHQLNIIMGGSLPNQTFYSDEFLLSYINYMITLSSQMSPTTTLQNLTSIYNNADPAKLAYLYGNSNSTKQNMVTFIQNRKQSLNSQLNTMMNNEILMLVGGIVAVCVFAIVLAISISTINKERVSILQVFLGISQVQIQQFSSKTEKFLISLHVQDTTGQIDVQDQIQNIKKVNSSTFAKKKRFKLISLQKSIYFKIGFIPLIASIFFIQLFVDSYMNLVFMNKSLDYFAYTAKADYQFYGGLSQIQASLLQNNVPSSSLSDTYIGYYRDYFDLHYNTFGQINDFHIYFTELQMLDICNGSIVIIQSCDLPSLAPNGTFLILTDMALHTRYKNDTVPLPLDYMIQYEVVSKTHRILALEVIRQQALAVSSILSSLLNVLLIWTFVILGSTLLYGVPIMKKFIDQINISKNILSILPISVAKQLPLAKNYFNKILKSSKNC